MSSSQIAVDSHASTSGPRTIKLLVWDLDNTLWHGTLLEDDRVRLRDGVPSILRTLDERGILNSIASKNEPSLAMAKLAEFGIQDYFLVPQINWNSKAANVQSIVEALNIGLDSVAFVDDEPFEREEVKHSLTSVLTLHPGEVERILERPEFIPPFITDESALRRRMYQADITRKQAESDFIGPGEAFLATLGMSLTISPAQEVDLKRAEELTLRTHQLNTTGDTYSYDELNAFRQSPNHLLLIAGLDDRFGSYGKIGLALVEKGTGVWRIKLFLMSCRVMSRGVGTIFMNHVLMLARDAGVRLVAPFRSTGRNRIMLITYKFGGFREIERADDLILLEHDLVSIQPHPRYVNLRIGA